MDRDDCDRKVVLRHFEAVLDRDAVRTSGVLGRELPPSRPELDPGEPPRCARGAPPPPPATPPGRAPAARGRRGPLPGPPCPYPPPGGGGEPHLSSTTARGY